MNTETLRRIWKKAVPFAFAAVIVGTAGSAIANKYLGGGDCCSQGAACCHPGASCCNGAHKTAAR